MHSTTYQTTHLFGRRAYHAILAIAYASAAIVLSGPAFAAPIKVACIGEHTTHSDVFPATNRESQPVGKQEYPAMLQTKLGTNYDVRNFGDCCATVLQGYTPAEVHPYVLGSLPGRGPGYTESLAFLPDIVVIGSWGRHDWGMDKIASTVWDLATFQKDYDDLVQRYAKLSSHPKIYVSLPIPILFGQGDVPDNGVTTSSVLPAVKAIAAKYNLPIIDLYTPFLGHKELFKMPPVEGEGEHVTDGPGLQLIADTVYAALLGEGDGGSQDAATVGDSAVAVDASRGLVDATPSADAEPVSTGTQGGPTGAGGSVMEAGGAAGGNVAGDSAAAPAGADNSGCACSATGRTGTPAPASLLAGSALAILVARRRKRVVNALTPGAKLLQAPEA